MTTLIRREYYQKILDIVELQNEIKVSDVVDEIVEEVDNEETVRRLVKAYRTRLAVGRLRAVCANEKIHVRSSGKHVLKILRDETDYQKELERLLREEAAAIGRREQFEAVMMQKDYSVQSRLFGEHDEEIPLTSTSFIGGIQSSEESVPAIGH